MTLESDESKSPTRRRPVKVPDSVINDVWESPEESRVEKKCNVTLVNSVQQVGLVIKPGMPSNQSIVNTWAKRL